MAVVVLGRHDVQATNVDAVTEVHALAVKLIGAVALKVLDDVAVALCTRRAKNAHRTAKTPRLKHSWLDTTAVA